MEGLLNGLYKLSEWVMRLAYLNLLWIFFTLLGLVLMGVFPATTSMYAVSRKWLMGESEIPVFKTFLHYFKNDFIKANILGYILVTLGFFLYIDLKFFQTSLYPIFNIITILVFMILFIYFVILLLIFPIFVHYDFKVFGYIKYSLILAVGRPLQTIMVLVGFLLLYFLFSNIPGLIPFFGGSLFSFYLMWIATFSFPKYNTSEKVF